LTLGRYSGLRLAFDDRDQQVLRCQRQDGALVGVEALSDGTRDQLYLSLRLAALEQRARHEELLPIVLDDILIHFDDERARAALGVLEGFASRHQILFFTHHARLLELADSALGGEKVVRLELPRASHVAPEPLSP
jgi:uncharacterized protein YhaN